MACGRLEMDGGEGGGEVHGVGKMKVKERDGSMCGWNMDDKMVGGGIGFSDSCWENCHINLGDGRSKEYGLMKDTYKLVLCTATNKNLRRTSPTQILAHAVTASKTTATLSLKAITGRSNLSDEV